MKPKRPLPWLIRIGLPPALLLVLAACTPGGQFDPTSLFANDMFDTKKKLQGQREPVFPNGVPGTSSGIPQDLVKGYQPPPDDTAADANGTPDTAAAPAKPEPKAQPKPKPKPKVARAPAAAPAPKPTRITVGPAAATRAPASPPPQGGVAQQSPWPAPPQAATPDQTNWPAPPPPAPAQQAAQPSQSIWPNPPAPKPQ